MLSYHQKTRDRNIQSRGVRMNYLPVQSIAIFIKTGYQIQGDSYLVEGCPHVWMYKELKHE